MQRANSLEKTLMLGKLESYMLKTKKQKQKQNYLICFCSVVNSCWTLCHPMDFSTPGFPVLHYLPEFAQIHEFAQTHIH